MTNEWLSFLQEAWLNGEARGGARQFDWISPNQYRKPIYKARHLDRLDYPRDNWTIARVLPFSEGYQ